MTFSDVIEEIKNLSIEEKLEIQLLLQQYLREDRRDEIYTNFKQAKSEEIQGKLTYSSDINELKELLGE